MVKCMKGKKKGNTCQKTNWLWEMIREVEREREREWERGRDEQMKVVNVNEYYTVSHELVCVFKAIASTNKT